MDVCCGRVARPDRRQARKGFAGDLLHGLRVGIKSGDERGIAFFAAGLRWVAAHVGGFQFRRRAGAHVTEEIHPLDQFHREEPVVSIRDQLVEGYEVRMSDVGKRAELLLETVQTGRIRIGQLFQRHCLLPRAVLGFENDAHSTGTNTPLNDETVVGGLAAHGHGRKRFSIPPAKPVCASHRYSY